MSKHPDIRARRTLLRALITYKRPLDEIASELYETDPEDDTPLVTFTGEDAIGVLARWLDGSVHHREIEEWAALIEGRPDVALEPGREDALEEVLHDLAHPLPDEPLERQMVEAWIERLRDALE